MAYAAPLRHVEKHAVSARRLGRRAPDLERINDPARTLQLGSLLTGVPAHATAVDHFASITASAAPWNILGNDKYGDCGPVSVANSRKVTLKALMGQDYNPALNDVFDLYRRSGNPQFNPNTGADDNGVDMNTMLQAAMSGGAFGTKPVAFASVDVTNQDECDAAIDLFGYLLLGIDLQVAQQSQTDAKPPVWGYKKSGEWGGHAVIAGKYTGGSGTVPDRTVESWALVVGTTDAFWQHQVQEAWVVIWPEHLGSVQFHAGLDFVTANAAFTELTGKPGPFIAVDPPVVPPVTPPVTPPAPGTATQAELDLWAAAKVWASGKGLS
jgi:hypothetical protein